MRSISDNKYGKSLIDESLVKEQFYNLIASIPDNWGKLLCLYLIGYVLSILKKTIDAYIKESAQLWREKTLELFKFQLKKMEEKKKQDQKRKAMRKQKPKP